MVVQVLAAPLIAGKTTAATITGILTGAGTALSALSAISQASAQAAVLRQQAEQTRKQAEADEDDFRRRQSRLLAERRAGMGGSGVQQGEGSPLLVAEDFAAETELQALRIRSGGVVRATRLEQQASLTRSAGLFRGGSLLLTGLGRSFG